MGCGVVHPSVRIAMSSFIQFVIDVINAAAIYYRRLW